jgi:hypothetical protein
VSHLIAKVSVFDIVDNKAEQRVTQNRTLLVGAGPTLTTHVRYDTLQRRQLDQTKNKESCARKASYRSWVPCPSLVSKGTNNLFLNLGKWLFLSSTRGVIKLNQETSDVPKDKPVQCPRTWTINTFWWLLVENDWNTGIWQTKPTYTKCSVSNIIIWTPYSTSYHA